MESSVLGALLQVPYGVYVLTTSAGSGPQTMVVSWVSQVSFSPPLLIAALRKSRPAVPAIREQRVFSLNLLKEAQMGWVDRFKSVRPAEEMAEFFEPFPVGSQKFHRLKDGLVFFACRVVSQIDPGDHILFVAEALAACAATGRPLITSDCGKIYTGRL